MKLKDKLSLYFTWMDIPYDRNVDKALQNLINKSNLQFEGLNGYGIVICNETGKNIAYLWNGNKWYAWLAAGFVDNYYWKNKRPSKKMMVKVYDWIEKNKINY